MLAMCLWGGKRKGKIGSRNKCLASKVISLKKDRFNFKRKLRKMLALLSLPRSYPFYFNTKQQTPYHALVDSNIGRLLLFSLVRLEVEQ